MTSTPSEPPKPGSNAMIWLKIFGMLAGIFLFGLLVFELRRLTF
jgi:hypothetical protein